MKHSKTIYTCPICNREINRVGLHFRLYHSKESMEYPEFISKILGYSSVPKCKYCDNDCLVACGGRGTFFLKTCGDPNCIERNRLETLDTGRETEKRLGIGIHSKEVNEKSIVALRNSGKGVYDPEVRRMGIQKQIDLGIGWFNPENRKIAQRKGLESQKINGTGPYDREAKANIARKSIVKSRETFFNRYGYYFEKTKNKNGRIYLAKVMSPENVTYVKVGKGSVWRRWSCILSLLKGWRLITLIETEKPVIMANIPESKYIKKYQDRSAESLIPKLKGVFSEDDGDMFFQSTGSSEWLYDDVWEGILSDLGSDFRIRDVTNDFLKFYSEGHVELLEACK